MKCVACGGANLIEGVTMDESGARQGVFKPHEVSYLKAIFGMGTRKTNARACAHCGFLHFYVEFTDEDRERYLDFDNAQPGVLAIIESEENV